MRLYRENNFVDVNEANTKRVAAFKADGWSETIEVLDIETIAETKTTQKRGPKTAA